jgi:hypothetical protein
MPASVLRRLAMCAGMLIYAGVAMATGPVDASVQVQGAADGNVPGFTLNTAAPTGWTRDCCTYAKAIGVNYVLYQGEWTGKPERVMVLNVWPSKLATLDDELQDDRKHYLENDPHGSAAAFAVSNPHMPCRGVLYAGSDHLDDVVVFCDPGKQAAIRYSWSMTVAEADPTRAQLLDAFKRVVERSSYATAATSAGSTHAAAPH